jgi:hypothetical protein
VLTAAVTERPLDNARQLSNVLHHRITSAWTLEPVGDCYTDWTPQVDDPQWGRYLATLAAAADARRDDLGPETAADPPQWAVEAFGPPPEDARELQSWERRAAIVAAHRELTGHDDPATPLGAAPPPGQVEAYASWRAAWRALGRPDADRDELEMSDGQLRMRIRGWQREQAWGPRYVANELAATIQAAETYRRTAALRAAAATTNTEADTRTRLDREAAEATALAENLDQRITELLQIDEARGYWLAHTAATRAAADRATAELSARRATDERVEQPVTAEEWLAAHHADTRAEDPHREITETDLAEVASRRSRDVHAVEQPAHREAARTDQPDIRDLAASEPGPIGEDSVRVPTANDTAESIQRAQRALAEIAQRKAADEAREAEETRAAQLARWHVDDHATERDAVEHTIDQKALNLDLAATHD